MEEVNIEKIQEHPKVLQLYKMLGTVTYGKFFDSRIPLKALFQNASLFQEAWDELLEAVPAIQADECVLKNVQVRMDK